MRCARPGWRWACLLRLFRPLPVQALRAALAGVPEVLVLDRNHSPGAGGGTRSCARRCNGMDGAPRVHGYLGVGGVNVAPEQIVGFARRRSPAPQPQSCWVR